MKYTVLYQSKTGNTKQVARAIYDAISSPDKYIYDVEEIQQVPQSDVYFIGFGIHNGSCGMDIIEAMEDIYDAQYAIFATCGSMPTEGYKKKIGKNLDVWLPEDADFLGMFLCQGKVEDEVRQAMIDKMPEKGQELAQLFDEGSHHPDQEDLEKAAEFARGIQKKAGVSR